MTPAVWAIAGTPTSAPYPCRCSQAGRCSPRWCGCAGRLDLDDVPRSCCAHYNTPAAAAAAHAAAQAAAPWRRRG